MVIKGNPPTAEKILSALVELYASQRGVKVTYEIVDEKKEAENDAVHR